MITAKGVAVVVGKFEWRILAEELVRFSNSAGTKRCLRSRDVFSFAFYSTAIAKLTFKYERKADVLYCFSSSGANDRAVFRYLSTFFSVASKAFKRIATYIF